MVWSPVSLARAAKWSSSIACSLLHLFWITMSATAASMTARDFKAERRCSG